jgi:predicted transcriptional regulator
MKDITKTLMICILFLGLLISGLGVGFGAIDTETENDDDSNSDFPNTLKIQDGESRSATSRGIDIDWGKIQVLSEPLAGQNLNTDHSGLALFAVENDKIYVVWHDVNNTNGAGQDLDIFFRYFNGTTWGDIQVISEPIVGQNISIGHSRTPDIAVEGGKIHVVWMDENNINGAGTDGDIFYRCNLTGTNWEDIQVISEPVFGQDNNNNYSSLPMIAVDNGKIHVVWQDRFDYKNSGEDNDIFYRCNVTGSGWGDIQVISEPVLGQNMNTEGSSWPDIAAENNKTYVVWYDRTDYKGAGNNDDIFYRANLTGNGWEDIQVISNPVLGKDSNTEPYECPRIAVENDNIYVVWGGNINSHGGIYRDIFYQCNLTGTNWENMQLLNEDVQIRSIHPAIAVDNGKIHVVWQDENNTNGAGLDADVFHRCNLTGSGWSEYHVISEPVLNRNFNTADTSTSSGTFFPNCVAENGILYVTWHDTNNTDGSGTDADISFRKLGFTSPRFSVRSPKVTPRSGNTSTEFNFTIKYYNLENNPPTNIEVVIDDKEYSMLEVDTSDIDYSDGKIYYFNIKKLNIGIHTYQFNISDGINYIETKLFNDLVVENTIPEIITEDNVTAYEDKYYETIYEYEDIDNANIGQSCCWEFDTDAKWLNFFTETGQLYGTPKNSDIGQYWVNIAVDDTFEVSFTNFTLTVLDVNDLPSIITENLLVTNEDELYQVDYDAEDIDSELNNQLWTLETNASKWLIINSSSGILNGTPVNDDVGEYWVKVMINDTEGGYDFTNFSLTVLNVNDDPVIITSDILYAESDKLYEVKYRATDIDSSISKQVWSLTTNATWLSIDNTSGTLSGTPTRAQAGWYNINISVSDGDGGADWHAFILTVYNSNLPPRIINEDIIKAKVNETYFVDYNATDDRAIDLLEWSMNTNASWLKIDASLGIISGSPGPNFGGKQYWVNITVRDTENGIDFHNFTLSVFDKPKIIKINNVPKLLNFKVSPDKGDTETEFTFSVDYIDSDGDPPDSIQVVIDGVSYDMGLAPGETPFNGRYEFKTKLSEGGHSFYFTASDGIDINTSNSFNSPEIDPVNVGSKSEVYNSIFTIAIGFIIVIIITSLFIGGTEVGKYKFVSLFVVPLYNRINHDKVFENYTRGKIHGYIQAKPGDNYNSIKYALNLKNGTLTHHTRILEKEGLIKITRDGLLTRFYPVGTKIPEENKLELKEVQEELIDIIRHQPGITQHEITNLLQLSQTTLSYNLISLTRNNLIREEQVGREKKYYINPESEESLEDNKNNISELSETSLDSGGFATDLSNEGELEDKK